MDDDPDKDADPNAPSPEDDPTLPPATQDELIERFAPHVHLNPDDPNRPANVDWYLARVSMRFHHNNCPDHELLPLGKVTQASLIAQSHADNKSLCRHDDGKIAKSTTSDRFFLEVADSATYKGAPRSEWKTYVVWRPKMGGLVDVEYWFFYPYNDNGGPINHESDWESVIVRLQPDRSVHGVYFCQHGHCDNFRSAAQLTWLGSHPTGWVADGSHATYPTVNECNDAPFTAEATGPNCSTNDAYRWFTWAGGKGTQAGYQGAGVVNVGEKTRPLADQHFIDYGGTWGEQGSTETTSGKRTPSFQDDWDFDRL